MRPFEYWVIGCMILGLFFFGMVSKACWLVQADMHALRIQSERMEQRANWELERIDRKFDQLDGEFGK